MTDPLDPDERWFAHLLASIPAPASLDTWTPTVTPPPRQRPRRRGRVTPLALALAVAILVGVVGAGLGVVLPRRGGGSPAETANAVVAGMPPARDGAAMAADPAHHRVLLFGGHATAGLLGDTWSWDGHRWSRDLLAGGPPGRAAAGMAADPSGGVVLFGGAGTAGALGDTWRWDGRAWTALHPASAPPATPAPLVVADIPLLFEGDRGGLVEGVLLVDAPEEVQLRRLMLRDGIDEAAARARVAAQMPLAEKRRRATWVIDNGGTEEGTAAEVAAWWERWVGGQPPPQMPSTSIATS